jgi:hypothetical protein
MNVLNKIRLIGLAVLLATTLTGCEPNVYGSIGVSSSSWGGYHGGGRMHGSVSVGGRIF